ncbi:MAG: isoamylase N-domain protein [Candidatus Krumholzibacteriota bacterium]|nr:isoamylase N-domain protein [Candidatus Krumholzibacteriota bacterium]
MKRRSCIEFIAAALLATLVAAGSAHAEVRIVEDEVVFSVRAPAGASVFLVGDFNNWNPTYEQMEEVDGRFEVRLYLLSGKYRYKFVVNGNWTADPDNPGVDPSHGSLLVLVERAGTLAFGEEEAVEKESAALLRPSLRYSGAFLLDEGETESNQSLDVWVSHTSDKVDARAGVKTIDESWDVSPLGAEILFDRGHVDLKLGGSVFKGFENDSIWSSSDPFHLVGDVGVYGYNAGFERRGVSAVVPFILNTRLRGFYSDKVGERPGPPPAIEPGAFDRFVVSGTPDTMVYRYDAAYGDEDVWALEFTGDMGSFDFGYAMRENRGYQPGSLAEVVKSGSSYETAFYTTREFDRGVCPSRRGITDGRAFHVDC